MPLSAINTIKEQVIASKPLVLAVFDFAGAATLRLSTDPLNTAEGGYQYGGQNYYARLSNQVFSALQSQSETGIDQMAEIRFEMIDTDGWIWTNYQKVYGFRGATVTCTFVFWEPGTANYSSDSLPVFVGRCDGPEYDENTLTVRATTKRNTTKIYLPVLRIQKRCSAIMPATAAQRAEAAADILGIKWQCAYSHDQAGGVGNSGFTDCDYTKAACVARGMYSRDSSNRQTGTFTGIQYDPPGSWRGKGFIEGNQSIEGQNNQNLAKYKNYVPMVYGTQWIQAQLSNTRGDPNFTHMELIVCSGYIGQSPGIIRVVVNGVEIPKATYGSRTMWWNWINDGNRKGAPNQQAPYDGNGDPYGGMAAIVATVPKSLVASDSSPSALVLVRGSQVRIYSNTSTYTYAYSENLIWIVLDCLIRAGWTESELDIQSFIDEAAFADQTVSHTDLFGSTTSQARFIASLAITRRRPISDILSNLRMSGRCLLTKNSSGKPSVMIEKTLAAQQPSTVAGSNDTGSYSSVTSSGGASAGYVAYWFNEDNYTKIRIYQQPINDTPNAIGFSFQDKENQWQDDLLTLVDSSDVALTGSRTDKTLDVEGITTYDQGKRVGKTELYKGTRGNPEGDTKGTYFVEIETTFRAVHLKLGHIVSVTNARMGLSKALFRITKIAADRNMKTCRIVARFHLDAWYVDSFGQVADPTYSKPKRDREARPPYAWNPNFVQVLAADPIYGGDTTYWQCGIAQVYEASPDGSQLPYVKISGKLTVNDPGTLPPPAVPLQGTYANVGGSISGPAQVFVGFCTVDSNGDPSFMSSPVVVDITTSGSTKTVTVSSLSFPAGAASMLVYAGYNPNRLSLQYSGAAASSITLTSLNAQTEGPPDSELDVLRARVWRVRHSGIWGAEIINVTSTTIQIGGATFTPGAYVNRIVTVIGRFNTENDVPVWNFKVTANTGDTLTLQTVNPVTLGVQIGDAVVMRSLPSISTSGGNHVWTDSTWINCFAATGLEASAEAGKFGRIIAGKGAGQRLRIKDNTDTAITFDGKFIVEPDSTSIMIVEEPEFLNEVESAPINNSIRNAPFSMNIEVRNYLLQVLLIEMALVDGGGMESIKFDNPVREIYLYGKGATGAADGYYEYDGANTVTPDLALGIVAEIELNRSSTTIAEPIYTGGTLEAGQRLEIILLRDNSASNRAVAWNAAYIIPDSFSIDQTPSTQSTLTFRLQPDGKWVPISTPLSGLPL